MNVKMKLKQVVCCGLLASGALSWAADPVQLKTEKDRLSYSVGASVGKNLKNEGADIDLDMLIQGFKSTLGNEPALLPEREVRQIMGEFQVQLRKRSAAKKQISAIENRKKGDEFLAAFKTQPGVQSLPGGVLYQVIKSGTGKKPLETDLVAVVYRGTLINGTEFDATDPGTPANLKVSDLIAGWKQALVAMPQGSKWHIVLPSQLAYGERGAGNDIGPNEVLVFDLELVAVK